MNFQGSVIKERGITFVVIVVKKYVLDNRTEANETIDAFRQQVFPGLPVILMAQDSSGHPSYYGRQDIAKFMASVSLSAIPWKEYTIN